ncbi:MAG: FkbM family methyltransferase [Actinomycetes bacterium]
MYRRVLRRPATGPDRPGGGVPWGHLGDHVRTFDLALPASPQGRRPVRRARVVAPDRCLVPRAHARAREGGIDGDSVATFLTLCDHARPGAVLDIGSNTGHYAFLARVYTDRPVVAFEPAPELARVARALGTTNGLPFPVEEVALSDQPGTATFYLSDGSDSSSSLRSGFRPSTQQIEVRMETLDGYVGRTGTVPAVLKIDTETTEPDVIRGGLHTLTEHRPWFICEVLPGRGGDVQIEALLEPLGYLFYRLGDTVSHEPSEHLVGDPSQYNWLFAPHPVPGELWGSIAAWRAALSGAGGA